MVNWIVEHKPTAPLSENWIAGRPLAEQIQILSTSRQGMTRQLNELLREADLLSRTRKDIDLLIKSLQQQQ